jgi:hypothetical protein
MILTNVIVMRELMTKARKEGCAKCGIKMDGSRLFYIRQIPDPLILKYEIVCTQCQQEAKKLSEKDPNEPVFRSEADVDAYEHEQHIFYSVCGGVAVDEEEAWDQMLREEYDEE